MSRIVGSITTTTTTVRRWRWLTLTEQRGDARHEQCKDNRNAESDADPMHRIRHHHRHRLCSMLHRKRSRCWWRRRIVRIDDERASTRAHKRRLAHTRTAILLAIRRILHVLCSLWGRAKIKEWNKNVWLTKQLPSLSSSAAIYETVNYLRIQQKNLI